MTKKQKRFVDEYLIDLNATQAAVRAGYSPNTAYSIGAENLKKPEIQNAIDERLEHIDCADQATITELNKYKRNHACIYTFNNAWKHMKIIDRILLVVGWIKSGHWYILDHCENTIREFENYSWKEDRDSEPEDRNDHCINSGQYGFIPHRYKIGEIKNGADKNHDE